VLVDFSAVHAFVFEQDSALILDGAVCKVHVNKTRDNNQQNEESTQQNLNLVFLLQQKARHSNRDVVVAGPVWVAVLQKVVTGCFISQNLTRVIQKYHLHCMP